MQQLLRYNSFMHTAEQKRDREKSIALFSFQFDGDN
jgi:hypothetical protein